jgi:hypothetical protein
LPARGLVSLCQDGGCLGHVSLRQFQPGKKHLTDDEPVDNSLILSRQLQAL